MLYMFHYNVFTMVQMDKKISKQVNKVSLHMLVRQGTLRQVLGGGW